MYGGAGGGADGAGAGGGVNGAVLFAKRVALERLEPDRPYSFWVDAHGRLEITEITLPANADSHSRHCIVMSARDAHGQTRVEHATIFDSGAYFNVEAAPHAKAVAVKGGLAWSFPGPCMYEFVNARAPGGPPPTPLPLKMRMVLRFEVDEQLGEREAREHPLVSAPRRAPPAVFASAIGAAGGARYSPPPQYSPPASRPDTRDAYEYLSGATAGGGGAPPSRFEPRDLSLSGGPGASSGAGVKYEAGNGSYIKGYDGGATRPAPSSTSYPAPAAAPNPNDPYRSSQATPASSVYLNLQPAAPSLGAKGGTKGGGRSGAPASGSLGMATLDKAFDKFDRDGSGYLSMKEVAAALRSLGMEVTPKTLAHFADADADGDGALRLGEFRALVATLESEATKALPGGGAGSGGGGSGGGIGGGGGGRSGGDSVGVAELMEAKVIFDRHDQKRNGFLTSRELRQALKDLHLQADSAQAISVLHEFDRDTDGRLDLAEFARLLRKLRALQGVAPSAQVASLRAAFRAFDTRGVGTIPVADVRPALMRAGVDTTGGVALAIFASLQDQPRTQLDFSQFQRISHAISSAGAGGPAGASWSSASGGAAGTGAAFEAPSSYTPSQQLQPVPAAYPYGRPATSSYPPPMSGSSSALGGSGFSAYPPGYQPTQLSGPRPPTAGSPTRGGPTEAEGRTLGRDEARRLARKPTTPAHATGGAVAAAAADPYALVPPYQR